MSNILVVDDDRQFVGMVAALLGEEGYEIVTAYDGETALRRHAEDSPDLVILDRTLPRLSGDEVCKRIRASSQTPILMLTGERGAEERAKLLDLGADDYLEKPFSRKELASRVRALLRRAGPAARAQTAASIGRLRVDPKTHVASVDGAALDLTPTEFRLLAALAAHPGEVLERRALLRAGWPEERDPDPEWLKAHLARLRSKLETQHSLIQSQGPVKRQPRTRSPSEFANPASEIRGSATQESQGRRTTHFAVASAASSHRGRLAPIIATRSENGDRARPRAGDCRSKHDRKYRGFPR